MKIFFFILITTHGLIHLMGFAKAFKLAELSQLNTPVSRNAGIMWLVSSLLFITTIAMMLLKLDAWWIAGVIAIVISQIVIISSWPDAKWGTIINIMILLPVIVGFLNSLPTGFRNVYRAEVEKKLTITSDIPLLTEEDLQHLPKPVKNYLIYVGAVGRPKIVNFRMLFSGKMKSKQDGNWMEIESQQFNFYNDPSRFFYIQSDMYGIPFDGLHVYKDNNATMQIKLASILTVADAKGIEMNQSETVTFFNDMCIFAPAGLTDTNIHWVSIDSLSVEATYTNLKSSIKADLFFNEKGELINFISNDRYLSEDGTIYKNFKWSTPVKNYKEFNGRKVPSYGKAIWHTTQGEFIYASFHVDEIEYNCIEFKY